ncbi:MAG: choline/carnitine O-acyltransferase [Galactobacter sp.]|uniref:choline/carnitine O-acyltransferase n=1 Tax=Galactobacter sp. TaxID=2676125 RepID=UPI0025C54025|nr:choline/carnitine O-acyltransferase [Galactobacter sp.]
MPLPPLPVPSLEHTLLALDRAATALARPEDPEELGRVERFRQNLAAFQRGDGPRLQEALEEHAAHERPLERAWFGDEWKNIYFAGRESLPLTTNVSFGLNLAEESEDPIRAVATTIHRIVSVHLAYLRGQYPAQVNNRGQALDVGQLKVLAGGVRHPRTGRDGFRSATASSMGREVGIIVAGRLFAVTVSDAQGYPAGVDSLTATVRRLLDHDSVHHRADDTLGFTEMSYLGSATLAPVLEGFHEQPGNAATYARLTDLLCTVTITDDGEQGLAERLRTVLLRPGLAWVYKPISYQLDLAGGAPAIHMEHSMYDGGCVAEIVHQLQSVQVPSDKADIEAANTAAGPSGAGDSALPVDELTWDLTDELTSSIRDGLRAYREQAARFRAVEVVLPRIPQEELPFRMSGDGLSQTVLSIAQLLAYGRVRSVYEAVDMRTFLGGRTEIMRPATLEAVTFARSLVAGEATEEQFEDLLDAHRRWVKACKAGNGLNRHLLALHHMSKEHHGEPAEFFRSPTLRMLQTDFLSTTSLGLPSQITGYTFEPTDPEGFGIAYTPQSASITYLISYVEGGTDDPQSFLDALPRAGVLLHDFVKGLQPRP